MVFEHPAFLTCALAVAKMLRPKHVLVFARSYCTPDISTSCKVGTTLMPRPQWLGNATRLHDFVRLGVGAGTATVQCSVQLYSKTCVFALKAQARLEAVSDLFVSRGLVLEL